jgi:E3 ubiquitin-protein ligase synoviolin
MEDPDSSRHQDDEQRRAEAAMEEFLRAQEEEDQAAANAQAEDGQDDDDIDAHGVAPNPPWMEREQQEQHQAILQPPQNKPFRLSYVSTSFLVAFAMFFYALRTRQQWYLALVYLSSSKWAYIVLGNALVATLISIFSLVTNAFLNGLRLHEAEGLGDFFRWNITETCLALTMFRSELNVKTGILFLILVLAKSLHWVVELREQHLRMTQEAVVIHPTTGWPGLQWPHLKLFICLMVLQLCDVLAVMQCSSEIVKHGPSVSILFAFEGAILLVSVMSSILLCYLHVLDGIFHYVHETTQPGNMFHGWIHPWKDYKATLIFAVEVQAQAAKFFFYVTFFAIVMTYYGLPINLFREVYMSFQSLKQRISAFGKYRQLMASMNRFDNPTEEELEEAGSTCIICRDEMTVVTTKRLPGCGHLFHKSCLRDW